MNKRLEQAEQRSADIKRSLIVARREIENVMRLLSIDPADLDRLLRETLNDDG